MIGRIGCVGLLVGLLTGSGEGPSEVGADYHVRNWEVVGELEQPIFLPRITVGPSGWLVVGQTRQFHEMSPDSLGILLVGPEGNREHPAGPDAVVPDVFHGVDGLVHLTWKRAEAWEARPRRTRIREVSVHHAMSDGESWSEPAQVIPRLHDHAIRTPAAAATSSLVPLVLGASARRRETVRSPRGEEIEVERRRPIIAVRDDEQVWHLHGDDQLGVDPSVAALPSGRWIIAYRGAETGRPGEIESDWIFIDVWNGDVRQESATIRMPIRRGVFPPSVAVADDGTVHVVWGRAHEPRQFASSLWHSTSSDEGRTWSDPERIWDAPQDTRITGHPNLAFAEGELHVIAEAWFWMPEEGTPDEVDPELPTAHHLRLTSEGWTEPAVLRTETGIALVSGVHIATGTDGHLWVVLTEGRNADDRYVFRTRILRY